MATKDVQELAQRVPERHVVERNVDKSLEQPLYIVCELRAIDRTTGSRDLDEAIGQAFRIAPADRQEHARDASPCLRREASDHAEIHNGQRAVVLNHQIPGVWI